MVVSIRRDRDRWGIAGVSIGYELAAERRVCLLEMEPMLAYHSTGRSAAAFLETYGNLPIRALTTASRGFLVDPPEPFDAPLVATLPLLYLARAGRADRLRSLHAEVSRLANGRRPHPAIAVTYYEKHSS